MRSANLFCITQNEIKFAPVLEAVKSLNMKMLKVSESMEKKKLNRWFWCEMTRRRKTWKRREKNVEKFSFF